MNRTLIVGDTLDFPTSIPDYPASSGYVLTYRLIPRTSGTPITIISGANGDDYRTQVEAVTTTDWADGEYSWFADVAKDGDVFTVDSGVVTLLPNPRTATAYDGRSPARKALDAVNAVLSTWGTNAHVQEYTIGNRSMRFATKAEAIQQRDMLKAEVWREEERDRTAAGQPSRRIISTRFSNA